MQHITELREDATYYIFQLCPEIFNFALKQYTFKSNCRWPIFIAHSVLGLYTAYLMYLMD